MFENLQVYQKAVAFAVAIHSLTKGFRRGHLFLAGRLNRAGRSFAGNPAGREDLPLPPGTL
jgi:hypothetical protein